MRRQTNDTSIDVVSFMWWCAIDRVLKGRGVLACAWAYTRTRLLQWLSVRVSFRLEALDSTLAIVLAHAAATIVNE